MTQSLVFKTSNNYHLKSHLMQISPKDFFIIQTLPMNPPSKTTTTKNNYEFCKVCKINHNLGRRHNYIPNHIKSLSSYLSKFQSKLTDIRLFVKNPRLVGQGVDFRKSFWCVFCDVDVSEETGCEFACEKAISHLASVDHLKKIKSFIWKYGGGMDQVDRFRVSEADLAKYEKKCMSMKSEGGGEQSHGPLIGPSNDIHNELKYDYVDNCDKSHISSYNITFPNHVLPLQNHTNENYQVSHSDHYGGAATSTSSSYDNKSLLLAANAKHFNNLKGNTGRNCFKGGYHDNGLGKTCQVYAEKSEANGEGSSAGLLKLTQISSKVHEVNAGNVHSGAPPPWFDTTNEVHLDPGLKPVTKTVKSKLNPKRVGAAWAEKRKLEMEMERRGELPTSNFDANWLPNFGRVWQSGSRKDSRKEFETEAKKPLKEETQSDSSLQLQPYVSKRMRREANG